MYTCNNLASIKVEGNTPAIQDRNSRCSPNNLNADQCAQWIRNMLDDAIEISSENRIYTVEKIEVFTKVDTTAFKMSKTVKTELNIIATSPGFSLKTVFDFVCTSPLKELTSEVLSGCKSNKMRIDYTYSLKLKKLSIPFKKIQSLMKDIKIAYACQLKRAEAEATILTGLQDNESIISTLPRELCYVILAMTREVSV
jgi:hypothetical protein